MKSKNCSSKQNRLRIYQLREKHLSLAYMNVLFLIVYSIPILYSFVIIGSTFFYGPIVLLGLLFSIPFILLVYWVKTRVYPAMKINFLNRDSLTK